MATNPSLGHIVWYDLMTQDAEKSKSFYTELLGLQTMPVDMGPTPYSMFAVDGDPFGGLVDMGAMPEMAQIPSHWMCYIEVEDVAAAAGKCTELGGKVMKEPDEIPGYGKYAVLEDPTGGFFAAWTSAEPKEPRAPEAFKPGMVCWNELMTTDVEAARKFYKAMHGWNEDEMPMGDGSTYYIQKVGDRGQGGIMQVPMEGIPSHWCQYFLVPNVDEVNQRALDMGGAELKEPTDIPGMGRFSVLSDPTHAVFAIYEITAGSQEC
jgi:uncharacterized protein